MEADDREKQQELHRELMVMEADYNDLNKRLANWFVKFMALYKKSDENLDRKE